MYSMQVPAVVTEITLHFNIHAFVYLLTALAAELLFSAFIKSNQCDLLKTLCFYKIHLCTRGERIFNRLLF